MPELTVYVDPPRTKFGRMTMCHMVADTSEELWWMAYYIGLNPDGWIQKPGTRHEHYDLSKVKRAMAVERGAVELTSRQMAKYLRSRPIPPDPQHRFTRQALLNVLRGPKR